MHVMYNRFTAAAHSDDGEGDEDLGAGASVRVLRTCLFL
jgi:hypothetical protein